jgi:hypothetical protein
MLIFIAFGPVHSHILDNKVIVLISDESNIYEIAQELRRENNATVFSMSNDLYIDKLSSCSLTDSKDKDAHFIGDNKNEEDIVSFMKLIHLTLDEYNK